MSKHESLFALQNGIVPWLFSLKGNIQNVEPLEVFKVYKPLDRGNTKLAKNILSFNLLPITTCEQHCAGCYDTRAMRYTGVRKKRYLNTSMAMHNEAKLEKMIVKQIIRSRTVDFVRLHVGGDFFSSAYVSMWGRIVKECSKVKPDVIFYTYTKTSHVEALESFGINVVLSEYKEGFNFAPLESVKALAKKYKGVVCPATLGDVGEGFCGSKCTACMKRKNVFFVEH